METLKYNLRELAELYERGVNITTELKRRAKIAENTVEAIKIAYDFQAGTCITEFLRDSRYPRQLAALFAEAIAQHFPQAKSIIDVGCGELTNSSCLFSKLGNFDTFYAMDLSLSRLLMGRAFTRQHYVNLPEINVFAGSMDFLPLPDNSIDLIISSHAVEPNRGREQTIIRELARVCRLGFILQEPDYRSATAEQRARMDTLGYVNALEPAIEACGLDLAVSPLPIWTNELNKTSFFLAKKPKAELAATINYIDPISKMPLIKDGDLYFSPDRGILYPVVKGVPNFDISTGIICTKYQSMGQGAS